MEVVFLSPHSDPLAHPGEPDSGGQCIYEHRLASALSTYDGISVSVFCRYRSGYPHHERIKAHYEIHRIECGGQKFIPKEQLDPVLSEFVTALEQYIENARHDFIVHAHYWDGIKTALMLKKRLQVDFPIVWTPHSLAVNKRTIYKGIENERNYNLIPRKLWENYGIILSDLVQISSMPEKYDLITHYDATEDQLFINPPGVDLEVFHDIDRVESRHYFNLHPDEFIIASAGRLTQEKGFHNVIEAAYKLKKLTKNFKVLLVGGSPAKLSKAEAEYLEKLRQLVNQLELEDHIIFQRAISHSDMKYLYGSTDVYLCLSEYEPFGLSVIEAMASGNAVIATNNGGPADIITDANNGFLVNSYDYARIAHIISQLMQQRDLHHLISQHAKQHATEQYSWQRTAKETLANYQRLLCNENRRKLEFINESYFLQNNL